MILVDLQPHHLSLLRPQQEQQDFDPAGVASAPGKSWTAVHDGLPICCGGLVPMWDGRAYAWTVIDADAGPHMLRLTRAIRSLLAASEWRRIEMAVRADFEAGRRWALALGFVHEVRARCYLPSGQDADIFVRL